MHLFTMLLPISIWRNTISVETEKPPGAGVVRNRVTEREEKQTRKVWVWYVHAAVRQWERVGVTRHALLLAVVGAGRWSSCVAHVGIIWVDGLPPRPVRQPVGAGGVSLDVAWNSSWYLNEFILRIDFTAPLGHSNSSSALPFCFFEYWNIFTLLNPKTPQELLHLLLF